MNAQELVSTLYQAGVVLQTENGQLLVNAPDGALTEALVAALKANKSDVIALLATLESMSAATLAVPKQDWPASYTAPLSIAQQRMLFVEELAGNASYYNMPVAFRLDGLPDLDRLQAALRRLVWLHDALRTLCVVMDQVYVQQVCDADRFVLLENDLSASQDAQAALREILQQDACHVFNLQQEWPIRVRLIRLGEQSHVLSINIHHIAADGWSASRILQDLGAAYRLPAAASPVRGLQYVDYVHWQQEWLASAACQTAKTYWIDQLKGAPQLHSLPTDFTRPSVQTVAGDVLVHSLDPALMPGLARVAREFKSTAFVIFQTVFAAWLARMSGETDIVFGTAVANRQPVAFVDTVGLFVNTLALRYAVQDGITFADLLGQAARVNEAAMSHQQLPFDVLVDLLQPVRSLGYNPLVQIMLVMQENHGAQLELAHLQVTPLPQRQNVAKFDIALHIHRHNDELSLHWEFNTALFRRQSIAALSSHFETLLKACLERPLTLLDQVALVAPPVDAHARVRAALPAPVAIHRLFEAQVAMQPGATALLEDAHVISYQALSKRVDQIAGHLWQACAGHAGRIGLCMEKSADLVAGMLAIFKIGAVYVPLDPYYPEERLATMIADAGLSVLLCSEKTALPPALATLTRRVPVEQCDRSAGCSFPNADATATPAYIIYTSGSTGKPKGVAVSHAALFYSLLANRELTGIGPGDVMPTIGSQAFGASLLEILLPLTGGGAVRIVRKPDVADLQQLMLQTDSVTVMHAVPSLMRQWLAAVASGGAGRGAPYPGLRLLLCGGEAVPDSLLQAIRQWRPAVQLRVMYGMTESAIVCSSYLPKTEGAPPYCIGKPHASSVFHVLNRHGQLQPPGVPGELHIGGLTLADGYINQPEFTAERFIAHPLAGGGRLYKTGDRVRLLPDGNHEFLGRVDHQVSLRGARIEPGEIDLLAASVPGVKQAVAHVVPLGEHEQTLALYFTVTTGQADVDALKQAMRNRFNQHLPDYMRPSILQWLDAFPLNPNGKVDRKKLPAPGFGTDLLAPESEIEQTLAALWCQVLQVEAVGVDANFFAIGGHSLMASKLATLIRSGFGITFPLGHLFAAPTVRECAVLIEAALREKYAADLYAAGAVATEPGDEILI